MSKSKEKINKMAAKIVEFGKNRGIPISQNADVQSFGVSVVVDHKFKQVEDFLRFVNELDPRFVLVTEEYVSKREFDSAVSNYLISSHKDLDKLKSLSGEVDQLGKVEISVFSGTGNTFHCFSEETDFYQLVSREFEDLEEDEQFDPLLMKNQREYVGFEDIDSIARKVSQNPKLHRSDTQASIKILVKTEIADLNRVVLAVHLDEMIKLAQHYYRTEVIVDLVKKAKSLIQNGRSKKDVASELDIGLVKLNKIL